jgi:hypothetical protein
MDAPAHRSPLAGRSKEMLIFISILLEAMLAQPLDTQMILPRVDLVQFRMQFLKPGMDERQVEQIMHFGKYPYWPIIFGITIGYRYEFSDIDHRHLEYLRIGSEEDGLFRALLLRSGTLAARLPGSKD